MRAIHIPAKQCMWVQINEPVTHVDLDITASAPVDVFMMDNYNRGLFESDQKFASSYDCRQQAWHRGRFTVNFESAWCLLIGNPSEKGINVQYHIGPSEARGLGGLLNAMSIRGIMG